MKITITSLIISIACGAISSLVNASNLSTVYQQAQANDPTLLRAQAQFNAAKEDIIQARSVLLPNINASASWGAEETELENVTSLDRSSTSYGVGLSMQIYHHDSWLRLDNAKKSAHRSDVSYQSAKQDLIIRVTQAYFNVLSAKDDLEFANAEKTAIERQLEQTKQRYSVGLTAVTAVHEAQAQYDNAVTEVIRAENNVFRAEEALRVITNVYPTNLDILDTAKFSASRPSPDSANEWQQTAEAKNLDLIAQKIGVDIAKDHINIAQARHYPTVDFNARYSKSDADNDLERVYGIESNSQSVGIELAVPIYSGGATSSLVRQAQSNYVAASQELEQTHRAVVQNARNSYNTVIAAVSGIKALEQSVISAESALKATEAGFEVGTRTIVDVLDSTRNLYNAKRNLSSTRYSYIEAILNLKRAAGTISEDDIDAINKGLMEQASS